MRDTADHQHDNHDHAFGVGAAHSAGEHVDPIDADHSGAGLHGGLSEHLSVGEAHAGSVLPGHVAPDPVHDHATFDDHSHIGDAGGGHFGLGIEHDHSDGLSGLHDSIHENGLGFHGDEHHGLGDGLHVQDHHDVQDHHHDIGGISDVFHH
jgi:hypothetical protein